jgi:ATP-dependent DNA ligase
MIFYPPKPTLITNTQPLFKQLEKDNRVMAELKFKGDRLVLKHRDDGSFEFWNRHGGKFRYKASEDLLKNLNSLSWKGECVLDGELLNNKTKLIKDHVVLWDVFLWAGESLSSKPFIERRAYLERAFGGLKFDNLWISALWKDGWKEIFDKETVRNEVEGLVMKRMDAKLILGRSSSPVVSYMWKVRKPEGLYKF